MREEINHEPSRTNTNGREEFTTELHGGKDILKSKRKMRGKFYAADKKNGTPGTYTRDSGGDTWTLFGA
jgi:hypothetical protein